MDVEEFAFNRRIAKEGDSAFIWMGYKNNPIRIILDKDKNFTNHVGTFLHSSIIGKPYGTKIYAKKKSKPVEEKSNGLKDRKRSGLKFVYVLPFQPDLWTKSLKHRTQILYNTDNSLIIHGLQLKPGSIIAESGTGSTSLSHVIIRTIAPIGKLYTFEFSEMRVDLARKDFEANLGQFQTLVEVIHRDVITSGFQVPDVIYDAIFLDLPQPWKVIGHVFKSLKTQGRVCSFSPCIEQTQKVCLMLKEYGFYDIETLECVPKEFRRSEVSLPTPNCFLEENSTEESVEKKRITGKTLIKKSATRGFADIAGHTGYLTFATK